jgi:hypothetical protein
VRISGIILAASLLLSSSLALLAAPGAALAAEHAQRAGRDYHTLTAIKKTKVQACVGPLHETGVGTGMWLYVRLNNKHSRFGAFARVMTNLLQRDYNAAPHRSDSDRYAVVSPDEMVRVKYSAYHKTVEFEIVASSIGGC